MKHRSPSRAYRSPLRDDQSRVTRERIEDAVRALMSERGPDGLTYAALAARAGMTERTVYRHFPHRRDLIAAMWREPVKGVAPPMDPKTVDNLVPHVRGFFPVLDTLSGLALSMMTTPEGREVHLRGCREWIGGIARAVKRDLQIRGRGEARKVTAVLHLLTSFEAWALLRDFHGYTGREAAEVSAWAAQLVIQAIGRASNSKAGREVRGRQS